MHGRQDDEEKITLSEREVRIIAREVAQEVVTALLSQAGLTMEHLIYLKSHAESMKDSQANIRNHITTKLIDVGFLLLIAGAIWYVRG